MQSNTCVRPPTAAAHLDRVHRLSHGDVSSRHFQTQLEECNEKGRLPTVAHRVDEDEGSQMSVCGAVTLEPDCNHVTIAGLETERSGHLDVPARTYKNM